MCNDQIAFLSWKLLTHLQELNLLLRAEFVREVHQIYPINDSIQSFIDVHLMKCYDVFVIGLNQCHNLFST